MALPKPVTARGVEYPSRAAAARALGVTDTAIRCAERYGWLDRVGEGRRQPVRVRGVVYPSQTAAAAALGVHPSTVSGALRRGTIDNCGVVAALGRKQESSQ